MKTEKEKLQAKTVDQLKRQAKKLGAKIITPEGKAKSKEQLINTIVMKMRLSGQSDRQTGKSNSAKDLSRTAKAPGKRTSAKGKTYYERRANRSDKPGSLMGASAIQNIRTLPTVRVFEITFLGPGYSTGARVKIEDYRFQESKIIPYDYSKNSEGEVALAYFNSLGIKIEGYGQSKKGFVYFTKNFSKSIKDKA
jgi:hypothetical protein